MLETEILYQFSNSWLQRFKQLHIIYKLVLARVLLQMWKLPILKQYPLKGIINKDETAIRSSKLIKKKKKALIIGHHLPPAHNSN